MNTSPKNKVIILIPARMESSRLHGKPLADISGKPMIAHVIDRAREADIGSVAVATDSPQIFDYINDYGADAIMTSPDHQSGSDRIHEAAQTLGVADDDILINLQGDLPTISPDSIRASLNPLSNESVDFATLASIITDSAELQNENVVKLVAGESQDNIVKALYFSRAPIPWGEGVHYHHIGLYSWRASSLSKFVKLPISSLERCERLEQLRALEAGMLCHACIVDTIPLGVDTQQDLEKAREILS